jgi:AAA ATPase-like protein
VIEEREPQLVTLVGVPGIGKSRLVFELFGHVDAQPDFVNWRQGRSLPYGEGVSFWALGEMVKAQAGILETDTREQADEKLRRIVGTLAEAEDADWLERHLRPLVGLEGTSDLGSDRRDEAFAAWRRFFEALAEQRPLVLVFEDLHFADDGLLEFVDHLVDWASGVPILVLRTARPELLARRPGWVEASRTRSRFRCPHFPMKRRRSSCTRCWSALCWRPASRRRCSSARAGTRSTPRSSPACSANAGRPKICGCRRPFKA